MGVRREKVMIANGQSMPGADMGEVTSADESEEHLPGKMPAKKRRRVCRRGKSDVKIESRIDSTASAVCHVIRIMRSLHTPMLYNLKTDFLNDDALILKAIGEFEAASQFWVANAKEENTAE